MRPFSQLVWIKLNHKNLFWIVNTNSTTFIVPEKVGLVISKCVRKILVISGVVLLVTYILKKNSGGK